MPGGWTSTAASCACRTSTRSSGPTRATRRATCSPTTSTSRSCILPHLDRAAAHDEADARRHRRATSSTRRRRRPHARLDRRAATCVSEDAEGRRDRLPDGRGHRRRCCTSRTSGASRSIRCTRGARRSDAAGLPVLRPRPVRADTYEDVLAVGAPRQGGARGARSTRLSRRRPAPPACRYSSRSNPAIRISRSATSSARWDG